MSLFAMSEEAIKVYARVRPCNDPANDYQGVAIDELDEHVLRFNLQQGMGTTVPTTHNFKFSNIFWKDSEQVQIFEDVALPLLEHSLEGYNATLFAYGQTGSGKTFTITGDGTREFAGIVPRAIQYVYEMKKDPKYSKLQIFISYLEIYNNVAYDLLTANTQTQMQKLEDLRKVTFVDNGKKTIFKDLSKEPADDFEKAHKLFWTGEIARQKAATVNNKYSSRSHTIFTFIFKNTVDNRTINSQINFVDLAGSEKFGTLAGEVDQRKREARAINMSLHHLQQVIIGINEKRAHIPFRDSVLTRFLKDSLIGNVQTAMIATISTNKNHVPESVSTCRFAESVSEITMKVSLNESELSPREENKLLRAEIARLREELSMTRSGSTSLIAPPSPQAVRHMVMDDEASDIQRRILAFVHGETETLDVFAPAQVQFCFDFMKELINRGGQSSLLVHDLQMRLNNAEKNIETLVKLLPRNRGGNTDISKEAAYLAFINSNEKYSVTLQLRDTLKERVEHLKVLSAKILSLDAQRKRVVARLEALEAENSSGGEIEAEMRAAEGELDRAEAALTAAYEDYDNSKEQVMGLQTSLNKARETVQREFQAFWEGTVLSHAPPAEGRADEEAAASPRRKKKRVNTPSYSTLHPMMKRPQ